MKQAWQGIVCFVLGLRALLIEAPLRRILWRMLGVLLLLMVLCMGGVFWLAETLVARYVPTTDTWIMHTISNFIIWPLVMLLSLLAGVLIYTVLAATIMSPWLDLLAARAEKPPNNPKAIPWWQNIMVSIYHTAMPLVYLLPFAVVAILCLLIPVMGVPLASIIWGYGSMRFLAFELFDTPASRQNLTWQQRKAHIQQHQTFYLGVAAACSLLMMIPVLNLLAVPAAVVGLSRSTA